MNIFQTIYRNAKIRCVIAVCFCVWVAALLQLAVEAVSVKRVDITEAFSIEDNVIINNCSVESTACLSKDGQYFVGSTLEKLLNELAYTDSNITSAKVDFRNEPVPCYYVEYESQVCRLSVTLSNPGSDGRIYLHLVMTDFSRIEDYTDSRKIIEDYYGSAGLNVPKTSYIIYSGIDGHVAGKMSLEDCNNYTDKIFARMGADTVCEGYDNYYTRYGYSASLTGNSAAQSSEGESVNFQIAYAYNETENMTEISVGTPFINKSY